MSEGGMTMADLDRKPLRFSYDADKDCLTIEGIKFAGDVFRMFANEPISTHAFRIKERRPDGCLILERVEVRQ